MIAGRPCDGASLMLVSVQDWDDDAVHLAPLHARVGRDARYRQAIVSLGGDLVRISSSVDFADSGGEAELLGLYFADAGQHLEHRLFVDHTGTRDITPDGAPTGPACVRIVHPSADPPDQ